MIVFVYKTYFIPIYFVNCTVWVKVLRELHFDFRIDGYLKVTNCKKTPQKKTPNVDLYVKTYKVHQSNSKKASCFLIINYENKLKMRKQNEQFLVYKYVFEWWKLTQNEPHPSEREREREIDWLIILLIL